MSGRPQAFNIAHLIVRLGILAAIGVSVALLYVGLIAPWHARWGATPAEVQAMWPGDEQTTDATYVTTRALTIAAPPHAIWPWIVQMGQGRGGLYSYESLENLVGCDLHNARTIRPEWQTLKVGDVIRPVPEGWMGMQQTPKWEVTRLEADSALVLAGFASFILQPTGSGSTRLVVRGRGPSPLAAQEPFSFVMIRRMMLGIKERAEGTMPAAMMDAFEVSLWLAVFVTAVVAAAWVLRRADWRQPFVLLIATIGILLVQVFGGPPLPVTATLAASAILALEWVRRSEHVDVRLFPQGHMAAIVLRLACGAGAALMVLAAIKVAGFTWQFWTFLVAPDIGVLVGVSRGLQPGQLHPRAVPLYNHLHLLWAPAVLVAVSLFFGPVWIGAACAWAAHVLFDRSIGLGLRDEAGFVRHDVSSCVTEREHIDSALV